MDKQTPEQLAYDLIMKKLHEWYSLKKLEGYHHYTMNSHSTGSSIYVDAKEKYNAIHAKCQEIEIFIAGAKLDPFDERIIRMKHEENLSWARVSGRIQRSASGDEGCSERTLARRHAAAIKKLVRHYIKNKGLTP